MRPVIGPAVVGALLAATPPLAADTVTGTVNKDGKLYAIVTDDSNQVHVTAMWKKRAADVDLLAAVEDASGELLTVGAGVATTDQFETMTFGMGAFVEVLVLIVVQSGPSTPFFMSVQSSSDERVVRLAAPAGYVRLREIPPGDPRIERFRHLHRRLAGAKPAA